MLEDPEAEESEEVVQEAEAPAEVVREHLRHLSADAITDPTMTGAEDITATTPAASNSVLPAAGAAELSLPWSLSQYICLLWLAL